MTSRTSVPLLSHLSSAPRDGTRIVAVAASGDEWETWWDASSGLWLANEAYDPETMIAPHEEPVELDERNFTGWRHI